MDILAELNPEQKEAVTTTEGPILVIAGAGTGKTRALTHRVAYMVEKKIAPESILSVTFTNKAAGELKERIAQLIGDPRLVPPWTGTFHSVCARILRQSIHHLGYNPSFSIYDMSDQKSLMKDILNEQRITDKRITPQGVLSHISGAKNELVTPEKYADMANEYITEIVAQVFPIYQGLLKEHNAVDFDDLLGLTVALFRDKTEVLERYQEQWKYVLIDEYQDTNHAQYVLVKLLAEKYRNICVVGDDWQGIYGWRGADIRNILNFESDYPEAKTIKLEQNYRSTQNILDAAQSVIDKNIDRTEKTLRTDRGDGEKIKVIEVPNEYEEGDRIVTIVSSGGSEFSNYAVLYRTNAQSRSIEEALLRAGLPYQIVGGVKFYERKEIKDMLAYLNLINNPSDRVSLLRVINVPARKIGKTALSHIREYAHQEKHSIQCSSCSSGFYCCVDSSSSSWIKTIEYVIADSP